MIVIVLLALWFASCVPAFFIGVGVGRDDQRARQQDHDRMRAAAARCERNMDLRAKECSCRS